MIQNDDELRRPENPVHIDAREAKRAFVMWRDSWKKPTNIKSRAAAQEFSKIISRRLDAKLVSESRDLGLPQSDATWARWNKSASPKKLRLDVCWQIYFLDGIDITANKDLASYPLNSTDMVILGPCRSMAIEGERDETRRVHADWISVRPTDLKQIMRAEIMKEPTRADHEISIGTVRYLLKNAYITISNCKSVSPLLKRIGEDDTSEFGSTSGVAISLDPRESGCWGIERPIEKIALNGRLDDLVLAVVEESLSDAVSLEISASVLDVFPDITLSAHDVTESQYSRLSDQLQEQVMRNRLRSRSSYDRLVLSIASVLK